MNRKVLKTASLLTVLFASIGATNVQADQKSFISGTWVIGNGEGILEIRGGRWNHSSFGSATIKRGTGASDFEVFYHRAQGTRCAYRAHRVAEGEVLYLEAADSSQSLDYCPSGKFSKTGN